MRRSELVEIVQAKKQLESFEEAEKIVGNFFDYIEASLSTDNRVELRNFGIFSLRHRAACTGHNPVTGVPQDIPSQSVPTFKAGKNLLLQLN